ncbi:MAG: ATP-binding protein [Rhodanobacter sp.]
MTANRDRKPFGFRPAMMVLAVGLLLLVGALATAYQYRSGRIEHRRQLVTQANILAASVTAAIAFDDRVAAQEYVNALKLDPRLDAVAVYNEAHRQVAGFRREGSAPIADSGLSPGDWHQVVVPARQGTTTVGRVYLRAAALPLIVQLARYSGVVLLTIMAVLMLTALAVAQSVLTRAHASLRRRAAELADANQRLSVEMEQRARTEEALRQSQKMEAIGQLSGGIAHDFNNLLTVIVGNADALAEELPDRTDVLPLVDMIRTAGERGAELTRHLLAFARRQALEPRTVRPDELVNGMHTLLRRTLGENVELTVNNAADVARVSVDPAQFESALLNLCINARDAMPGGGKLMIETANVILDANYTERRADVVPGDYVRISISDTGTGMNAEDVARAFEPFFTTKARGQGTGLGLSMVYGFVKQSGGHVAIYSEPGHGTVVTLYLRQAKDQIEPVTMVEPADIAGRGERILLVEDDDLVRAHAVQLLTGLGYGVVAAANGPEALALLRENIPCDALFTDVIMPGGLTGPRLAEAARALRPGLPVLYTSGYTENAIIDHGRVDPGINLLHKPYRKPELAAKLRAVLGEKRAKDGGT